MGLLVNLCVFYFRHQKALNDNMHTLMKIIRNNLSNGNCSEYRCEGTNKISEVYPWQVSVEITKLTAELWFVYNSAVVTIMIAT